MIGRTHRQAAALAAIRSLTVDGVPPTFAELGAEIGIGSRGTVHRLLADMRTRGLVSWRPGCSRSLTITEDQVSPAVLDRTSDVDLRRLIAMASGVLAQRTGGHAAQEVLMRIAERLPGASRGVFGMWTAEQDAILRNGRSRGDGCKKIGSEIGVTASAVSGRAHRLGLPRYCEPTSGDPLRRPASPRAPPPAPPPSMIELAKFDPVVARALAERMAGR